MSMTRQKHNVFFVALGEGRKVQEIAHDLLPHYRVVLAEAELEVQSRTVENAPTEEGM